MNETRLWYCDVCDKTIKIKSKSKYINSKTYIHKKIGTVVKKCEFIKPEIDALIYILDDTIKDFHSFEYRCVYDIKFRFWKSNNYFWVYEIQISILWIE